jgi:hypothetical protein
LSKAYYAENKEQIKANRDAWKETESGKRSTKEIAKRWINDKYNNDANFKKAHLIRCGLGKAWRWYEDKGEHRVSMTGDLDFAGIFAHMGDIPDGYHYGKPFDENSMSIDHIVDLRSFDLADPVEFRAAVRPENHRWLTRRKNYDRIWDDGYDVERHREFLFRLVSPEGE